MGDTGDCYDGIYCRYWGGGLGRNARCLLMNVWQRQEGGTGCLQPLINRHRRKSEGLGSLMVYTQKKILHRELS